jgi:hypothetical protein
MKVTSPSQQGIEGTDWEEDWILTAEVAILVMCASLLGTVSFFPIKETHFLLSRYR